MQRHNNSTLLITSQSEGERREGGRETQGESQGKENRGQIGDEGCAGLEGFGA
jgi:hypothetical protein